jgi:acetyl-CoA carboxylase carboxyltransferase component
MNLMREKLESIEEDRNKFILGGGAAEIEKQHAKGRLTARERLDKLLDPGSFRDVDLWSDAFKSGLEDEEIQTPGDGVAAGSGEINGRPVFVWAQDATVLNGTMAEIHMAKIIRVMEKALTEMVPVIGIYDSEGMRMTSRLTAHASCSPGTMMRFQTLSSGVIPQISLIMGPCIGPAALSAMLADFVFMVKDTSHMHVAPAPEGATGEETGKAAMHASESGCCDVLADDEEDCLKKCRELLAFLPQNNTGKPPVLETDDDPERMTEELLDMVPAEANKWFEMRNVIKKIVDDEIYFEVKKDYARNLTVGFSSFNGKPVGIIANNSVWKAGCQDTHTAEKQARFTRFCDAFNIPLVYLADCPAFFPSVEEEHKGILRHGCMVVHATAEANVPKISIFIRKLYGGAALVMPSNINKTDRMLAWPSVQRGLMGAAEMASVLFKGDMKRADSPEEQQKVREKGIKRMEQAIDRFTKVSNEDFIDPRHTRSAIIRSLKFTANKTQERPARKHENINL